MRRSFPILIVLALVLLGLFWFGRQGGGPTLPTLPGIPAGAATGLRVLAGSELKDLEPLLADIRRATGVEVQFTYSGTLDGVERLMAGEAFDAAWFSHGKYLTLLDPGKVAAQERIMLSPVVLGVKSSKADAWGWTDGTVTWRDVAERAASGELRYAMTNPSASNSGFTALMGVSAAFAGSADALEAGDIPTEALREFFRGQALTAGSSGWLADSYLRDQEQLDGLINYESVLLSLNADPALKDKLELIYPEEGIVTADYPLMLLNADKRGAYDRLSEYLRSDTVQRRIMDETRRRPVNPQVSLGSTFPDKLLIELPFPNSAEVIDQILFSYLDEQRVPAHAYFVLDVSGSMEGDRLADLKQALINLTGQDQSLGGRFARFSAREQLTLLPFSDRLLDERTFTITDPDPNGPDMSAVRRYASGLQAGGGTAIFATLIDAYSQAASDLAAEPDRYYSVVVLSDGENTEGPPLETFLQVYRNLPPEVQGVRTFAVLFGAADASSMQQVAEATGGRVFDGRQAALSQVFKEIRGYQ